MKLDSYLCTKETKIRFKVWLMKKGITQTEFAKRCNLSSPYISMIINGQRPITKRIREIFTANGYEIL